jgi:hypothetical protein
MATKLIAVHTIDAHPAPEKVFETMRKNWGSNLYAHVYHDLQVALKTFAKIMKVEICWSYSDNTLVIRDFHGEIYGESSCFNVKDADFNVRVTEAFSNYASHDMTGSFWDSTILSCWEKTGGGVAELKDTVFEMLDSEIKYCQSGEYLFNLCKANEYYFFEDGQLYKGE